MFSPMIEDFFALRKQRIVSGARILLFLDIDGVVRVRKGPVPQEIIAELDRLVRKHHMRVILITGAPAYQLPKELLRPSFPLHRAFAESGAVERLHKGILRPHKILIQEFKRLESCIGVDIDDGLVHIPALGTTIIREGRRLTSFTAIMGHFYPPHPHLKPSGTHTEIRTWLSRCITDNELPFVLMEGHEQSYSYIDVIHKDVGKEWRVNMVLRQTPYDVAFYIGDGSGDEAAMALPKITPVALANSTAKIKVDATTRGFRVEKSGPDGTYEFLSALQAFLEQIS